MRNRKHINARYLFVLLVLAGSNGIGLSAESRNTPVSVVHCPNQKASLEARWQWALEQISKQPATKRFWIGFSTERLMSQNSFIGRWPVDPDYPTLSELIYGVRVEWPKRSYSEFQTSHKVVKEVAHLFEVHRTSKSIGQIRTSNISLTVYMERGVLFWLGKVGHEQALSLLRKLYDKTDDNHLKMRLVGRITDFDHPRVISFLDDVLQNEESARVRKEAVDELDHYHSQEALDILIRTVRDDSSEAVRKEAIGSISHIDLLAAEDALMEIARTGPSPDTRREAIDELSDISSSKVIDCLENIINNKDEVYKIRLDALEALTDIENDGVLDVLIRIAGTHIDPRIRLEAIDQLGDKASTEVMDCLNRIVNKQGELYKIQEEALERLADIEEDTALDRLIQIVKTHTDPRIRREGINRLSDIDELRVSAFPRIVDCLVSVVNKNDELEENQREALEALTDIEHHRTIDELIRIAENHVNPRIREEAVDQLSDMDELRLNTSSSKVIKCFESIIDNYEELEKIQRKALDALIDIEHPDVRTYIKKIARSHPKQKIRKEAQEVIAEWIRDS